ncbi:MAG: hypothetical protein Q4C71_03990 [Microbacteriaceae bacterium]|nr:hypothetical protein [Microbacteriaceae bacterium]
MPASERANTDVTGAGGSSARVRAQLSAGPPPGSLAVAVPVPWRVQRNRAGEIVALQNVGEVPLLAVRCCVAGPAFYAQTLPVDVAAGERIEPRIRLLPPEHSSSAAAGVSAGESRFDGSGHLLVVRWRDMASGGELLWSAPVL